jgi:hypothetical protein
MPEWVAGIFSNIFRFCLQACNNEKTVQAVNHKNKKFLLTMSADFLSVSEKGSRFSSCCPAFIELKEYS